MNDSPSVLWHCWLGGRKGIGPVKNWVVGCWRGYLSGAQCRLAYGQWCIANNGGGCTQRGVAKGLKVPCLFMITEVSIRCKKNSGGWYTPYTRLYPPIHHCIWPSWCHCHSLSLASVKSTLVLPFWYRLNRVVLDSDWQWHQLGHMQVCTSLQTDNHASTTQFFTGRMPFLAPNQQRQSTEGTRSSQWCRMESDANFLLSVQQQ